MENRIVQKISHEKLEQVVGLLPEFGLDCWLLLARESYELCDPSLRLLFDSPVTWQSAFLIHAGGERIAIVGRYDMPGVEASGGFTKVIGYDEEIAGVLRAELKRLEPERIGLNFSRHDHTADGLTMGMYLSLQDWLEGTPFRERLVSAERLAGAVRARKTAGEMARIQAAVNRTVDMLEAVPVLLRTVQTEQDLQRLFHEWADEIPADLSWGRDHCPTVNFGPKSVVGHAAPGTVAHGPGQVIHLDFGLKISGYCADLQRCWYIARPGEEEAPAEVHRAFETVAGAIKLAAEYLRPGRIGAEVDRIAREHVIKAGYPEYKHAPGHQIGRTCHDGGALLGPRWPRYGDSVERSVTEGEVYTLELNVMTEAGIVSLEEMVVVTADGCRFLTRPQDALPIVTV